jgi:hypothetical protein
LLPSDQTQLGDELIPRILSGDFVDTGLCASRDWVLASCSRTHQPGAPPAVAARWVEQLLKVAKAKDAIAALSRHTGDATRDLPPTTLSVVRRTLPDIQLDGEPQDNLAAMGRIFGEDLPSGLVFHE